MGWPFSLPGIRVTVTNELNDKLAKPTLLGAGQARAKQRENRQAAALRANLSRRKAQNRVRMSEDEGAVPEIETEEGGAKPKA